MAPTDSATVSYAHQTLSINSPDGPIEFTLDDLSYYVTYGLRITINYGTQLGASTILLIILVLLTPSDKRRSLIFSLNTLALVLNIIRLTLACLYYTGPFYQPYTYFSTDYSGIDGGSKATSVATNVMTLLVLVCVLASLIFQIRVVCVPSQAKTRFWLTVLSISVAMVAVGFRFALVVLASKATVELEPQVGLAWVASATNISMTIALCLACVVFLWKLGWAIMQRRRLGIRQFGPMQAIFVMGTQTLLIPAIFSIFQYVGEPVMLQSVVLTSVALFLPLSAMWAAAQVDNKTTYAIPTYGKPSKVKKSLLDSCGTDDTFVEMKSAPSRKGSHYTESEPKVSVEGVEVA